MAAINPYETHHLHRATKWQELKRSVVNWLEHTLCCGYGLTNEYVEDLLEEERFQEAVLECRLRPSVFVNSDVDQAYTELQSYRERSARNLFGDKPVDLVTGVTSIDDYDPMGYPEDFIGPLSPKAKRAPPPAPLLDTVRNACAAPKVVARVVAAVISSVDSRVGPSLVDDDANRLVVRTLALQTMRNANFRECDISVHCPHVVECYFMAREHLEKAGHRRRRLPKWLVKTLGFKQPSGSRQ